MLRNRRSPVQEPATQTKSTPDHEEQICKKRPLQDSLQGSFRGLSNQPGLLDEAVLNDVDREDHHHESDSDTERYARDDVVKRGFAFERGSNSTATAHRVTFTRDEHEQAVNDRKQGR